MFALWRSWDGGSPTQDDRIAKSLGLFAEHPAAFHRGADTAFAFLPTPRLARPITGWKPAVAPDGARVLFDGWLDDRDDLARQLGIAPASDAELYGAAVARWGDEADARLAGHYAVALAIPGGGIRLSRTPWTAPPIHYANDGARAIVASVPRVLLAAGVSAELDPLKLADSLIGNLHDEERGWYRRASRVPQGSIVHLGPGVRRIVRWYDPHAAKPVRFARDDDYVEAARELLGRAVDNALAGVRSPAIALSGGLDSSLVTSELLPRLGAGRTLRSFTFRPLTTWDGRLNSDEMGDEGPLVEAFAARHPALEPGFTRNEGGGFDTRLRDMFLAMGVAPAHMANYYIYHGVWQGARDAGCDWLLDATLGNQTLSNDGRWSYVEDFLRLRWGQLRQTLARRRGDPRPLWRKLASLSLLPLLPAAWREPLRRVSHPRRRAISAMIGMIRPEFAESFGSMRRAQAMGAWRDATFPRSRRESVALDYIYSDYETSDIHQGFEQVYGLRRRDVTAYRPLVDFCLGLPTRQFVSDGEERWLAKRLALGRLPEAQRLNRRYGRHDPDWHARLGPRRGELLAEIERIAGAPELAEMLDIARMRRALEDWPSETPLDPEEWMPRELGVPRALIAARFVRFVTGRNDL